jgi:tetratricopeptide (TPR) repeat protein
VLEEATTRTDGSSVRYGLAQRVAWLGEAASLCGRPQEAWRLADEALRLAWDHGERGNAAWALRLLGDLAADREQLSEAEPHYRDALALADALGMRPLIAHCHRGLGVLHRRAGDLDRARRELRVARDLYRDMGMTGWLERADSDTARSSP